jgi:hypothetical protein
MLTKEQILLAYTIFLFAVIQLSALAGTTLVGNVPEVSPPSPPGSLLDIFGVLGWIKDNILFFFDLMRISTNYRIFGAMIITPFVILLVYIIIDLIIRAVRGG